MKMAIPGVIQRDDVGSQIGKNKVASGGEKGKAGNHPTPIIHVTVVYFLAFSARFGT